MRMRKYMGGVTLLELMIVVVVIGIMMAIAYPNYRDFTARAKRNEARALLLEIATAQERFYLQNSRYGSLVELGYPDPIISDTGTYAVTVGPADAVNFSATATYQKSDAELGKCTTFTIDGRGIKGNTGSYPDCWTRTR
ncbi:MAG: prepilin-type N-terminal cleavage/methylation domain-containing protein [Gammaproteobacteria bacterium]|nr:prepilin-type N-terminal cleavage/methylation domain-containing protein [Gammaproteobacteria bacterium]